jgi:acetyl esterase
LRVAALVLLGLVALGLVVAAVTAVAPGTDLLGADASPVVVVVYGPLLALVGVVATVEAWVLVRILRWTSRAVRRVTTVVAALTTAATLVLVGTTASVLVVTLANGGSVDLGRALALSGPPDGSAPDARPVYGTTPDGRALHLAVTRPRGVTGPAPVLVWVHGGGWSTGSELDRAADMRRFADAGWLAVSVEYTLATPGRPTWDVAGPQVACALSRIAEHAGEYGGDPQRLVLAGDSAGGQLAVSVGERAASRTQPSACPSPAAVPVPRAIATVYPAVDLADTYAHGRGAQRPAVTYTGGTPEQVPDRYRAVSGSAALAPGGPPVLAVVPGRDRLVPPDGTARFVETARGSGVDAESVTVPFADHAFDTGPDGSLGHQAAFTVLERWATEQTGLSRAEVGR